MYHLFKMNQKTSLPYLVASIGIILSISLWHMLWDNVETYLNLLIPFKAYLSWLVLLLGISFSILIGTIILILQLNGQHATLLDRINEILKKEINDRVAAEETKQKLEVALLQGQKLQAIGTLAGGIAHDFNNILYAIIGYVEIVRQDVDIQ